MPRFARVLGADRKQQLVIQRLVIDGRLRGSGEWRGFGTGTADTDISERWSRVPMPAGCTVPPLTRDQCRDVQRLNIRHGLPPFPFYPFVGLRGGERRRA